MIQHTNTYLHDSDPVQTYGVTRSSLYTIYTLLVLVYAGSVALCLVVLVIQKQPGDPWYHSFLVVIAWESQSARTIIVPKPR